MTKPKSKSVRELEGIVYDYEIPGRVTTDKTEMISRILKWHDKHWKERVEKEFNRFRKHLEDEIKSSKPKRGEKDESKE